MVLPHLNLNSAPSIKCLQSQHFDLLQRVTFGIFSISVNLAFISGINEQTYMVNYLWTINCVLPCLPFTFSIININYVAI